MYILFFGFCGLVIIVLANALLKDKLTRTRQDTTIEKVKVGAKNDSDKEDGFRFVKFYTTSTSRTLNFRNKLQAEIERLKKEQERTGANIVEIGRDIGTIQADINKMNAQLLQLERYKKNIDILKKELENAPEHKRAIIKGQIKLIETQAMGN